MSTEFLEETWARTFIASFRTMADAIRTNAEMHKFWDEMITLKNSYPELFNSFVPYEKAARLALVHSEVSECLEAVRKPCADQHLPEYPSEVVELADAVIRLMDYAARYNLPLAQAIIAKHTFNKTRPIKHGGKAF